MPSMTLIYPMISALLRFSFNHKRVLLNASFFLCIVIKEDGVIISYCRIIVTWYSIPTKANHIIQNLTFSRDFLSAGQ